jgi:hypothetical protein
MIVFSPARSTTMKACPVGMASRRTRLLSTPHPPWSRADRPRHPCQAHR